MKSLVLAFSVILLLSPNSFSQTGSSNYYFVFLNTNPDREELPEAKVEELQKGHLNNITKLAEEDKLMLAGPFYGGGGIFVLVAKSFEEASGYLTSDPAIDAGRFLIELYPAELLHGQLCKAPENFTMETYTFIRHPKTAKPIVDESDLLLLQMNFDEIDDGITILNYNSEKTGVEDVEAMLRDDLDVEYIKSIWLAKESLCVE